MSMMYKEKLKFICLSLMAVLVLGGCSQADQKKDTQKKSSESVIVNGLELELSGFEEKKMLDVNQKEQDVYTVHVKGKNVSSSNKGLGAIDFILETKDGKEVEVTSDLASFGGEVKTSGTIEGDLFFTLKSNQEPSEVQYKPEKDDLYSWKA